MNSQLKFKKIVRKILKVTGWIAISVVVLLLALIVAIRIPAVQEKIVQKAVSFLQDKIGTPVRLKSLVLSFPKKIVLNDLYVEDQRRDTLLFASEIGVDVDMWALMDNKIELNTLALRGATAAIRRNKNDSTFNFDYIPAAFASGKTTEIDTTSRPWVFSMENIELEKIKLSYADAVARDSASLFLGELKIEIKDLDLTKAVYRIGDIELRDSKFVLQQSPHELQNKPSEQVASTSSSVDIDFNTIELTNVDVSYDQLVSNQSIRLLIGKLTVESNELDLNKQTIDFESVELRETSVVVKEAKSATAEANNGPATSRFEFDLPWSVRLAKLSLEQNTIQYDDTHAPKTRAQLDFNHLLISFLNIHADEVQIAKNRIGADLKHVSFRETSGFSIQSLSSLIAVDDSELKLQNFRMESGYSKINFDMNASYASLDELVNHYEKVRFKLDLKQSQLSVKDARLFARQTIDSMAVYVPASTNISLVTSMQGTLRDLSVDKFLVTTLDSTSLAFRGHINGLPDVRKTSMDLDLEKFYTTGYDVKLILPDTLLPDSIRLPKWVMLKGKLRGTIQAPDLNTLLTSDVGEIAIDGKFDFDTVMTYNTKIVTKEFDLGKVLRQEDTMGVLNLEATIIGSGQTTEDLNADIDLTVNKFQYNQYDYEDFRITGSVKKYLFTGGAAIRDKNIDLEVKGEMNYNQKTYNLTVALANADFQALHLSERPLKARGTVDVNLTTTDFKVINGKMDIRKVAIFNGKDLYMVDSLLFASLDQKGASTFSIRSDILSGDFKGTFNLFSLPGIIRQHINHYFSLQDTRVTEFKERQNFEFDLVIKNTDLLTEIIFPELDHFTPGKISGSFDSEAHQMNVDIELSKIRYADTGLDSLDFRITSDEKALRYSVLLKNLTVDTIHVNDIRFTGRIAHDSINTSLRVLDSIAKDKYRIGGVFTSMENDFRFHLVSERIKINYKEWSVPDDNYLQFGTAPLKAYHFDISNQDQKIALITDEKDATISLEFNHLQLSDLTRIIRGQVPAAGVLDGNFKVTTAQRGNFSSRLYIHDLTFLRNRLGDLTLSVAHVPDRYNLELLLKGDTTNFKTTGFYSTKDGASEFDLDVNLNPLDLKTIEPFTFGFFKNVRGVAMGDLHVTGTPKEPSVRGNINFKDASFTSRDFNSSFTLANEKITFDASGISFNTFTIKDERGQVATVRGSVLTKTFRDFEFDLRINARNFQVLNTTADNSRLYYGLARVTTDVKISGDVNSPVVSMTASLSDDTNLTYVVPQEEKSILEQKGIVEFVDRDKVNDPFLATINLEDTIKTENVFKGIDLTATLEINDKEILNIIIDPVTGDKLSVQGNSTLTVEMNPSGDINLSGRYGITKGTYDFSFYKLVKRQFIIEDGGSITWSGDPMKAALDIRASYMVETSPIELIANQITEAEATTYKQVLPFLVYLNIKGQILTPEISFALDMPDNKRNVFAGAIYSKLQDINTRESDLNKQVFALLILKRFIADNPLENQAAGGIANTTRQSVSRILSDQLNRLAENVKGVQLSLDIKSYQDYTATQSTGQTKVQLGVTKNLLNDRLVVKLSGNVDIEGQNTNAKGDATDYIGDLALEYKLTPDGRLRITGFRNSNYDMISGELTETGTGLIYIKDYNTLRELFKPNAKPK